MVYDKNYTMITHPVSQKHLLKAPCIGSCISALLFIAYIIKGQFLAIHDSIYFRKESSFCTAWMPKGRSRIHKLRIVGC
jgi:hypothetical protein